MSRYDTERHELDQGPEMLGRLLVYAVAVVSFLAAWVAL